MNLSSRYSARLGWISKSFLSNLWKGVGSDMLLYICTEKVTVSFGTLSDVSGHLVNVYAASYYPKRKALGIFQKGIDVLGSPVHRGLLSDTCEPRL